jgi:hypothetical protein
VQSNNRPLWRGQYHEGDLAARKVLLVSHVLVGGQKYIETRLLGRGE